MEDKDVSSVSGIPDVSVLTWQALHDGCIFTIDKPLSWTSFDAIKKVKSIIRTIKVGHAGTLDPLASGLLIICTGRCTKRISELQDMTKEYTGTFRLGATTPSFDKETEEDAHYPTDHITEEAIYKAAASFRGEILQIPPVFSSIKVKGERSYDLARRDEAVELKARPVNIYSFDITAVRLPDVDFKITVSKGFYVRALAADFGKALNSGAYLTVLRRTRIGDYSVDTAWQIDALSGYLIDLKKEHKSGTAHGNPS